MVVNDVSVLFGNHGTDRSWLPNLSGTCCQILGRRPRRLASSFHHSSWHLAIHR